MMWRTALLSACTTGAFCAVFALVISSIAPMLSGTQILATSFVSGFLGSLVARALLNR
jgi:predicted membrane-bound spermidine synthase